MSRAAPAGAGARAGAAVAGPVGLAHLVGVLALVGQADPVGQGGGDGGALLAGVEHAHLGDPGVLVHAGQQEPGLPPEGVALGEEVDDLALAVAGHDPAGRGAFPAAHRRGGRALVLIPARRPSAAGRLGHRAPA